MIKKRSVSVIGLGVVGLTTAVGLAMKGHEVVGVDIDEEKVARIAEGECPIYEKALSDAMKKVRIMATTDFAMSLETEVSFLCGGTPGNQDGSISLRYVKGPAEELSATLRRKNTEHLVVVRSTVVPGTTERAIVPFFKSSPKVSVCVNPEFLREGTALEDFLQPTRIIVGEEHTPDGDQLVDIYGDIVSPVLRTNIRTAEMIKYASNAFLATKISYINEIGNICKKLGIDVYQVADGMGHDQRIGAEFLRAGIGFGGFCLPKDTAALVAEARALGYEAEILKGVIATNRKQPLRMIDLLMKHIPDVNHKVIGVLGLAFKPGTDDIRESKAIPIIEELLLGGARIRAHDPRAMDNFKRLFPQVEYGEPQAVADSDAVLIVTEWEDYNHLDYRGKIVIDGRRVAKAMEARVYEGVCW